MKKLLTIAVGVALLALPLAVNAGVAGGAHDLTTDYSLPTGGSIAAITNLDVCTSCHVPHKATTGADKLWAQAVGGTGAIADLCESCHDGTVAAIGITTGSAPFTNALHPRTDVVASCSGDDGTSCHDVHDQNNNTDGKFLTTAGVSTGECADCHNGTLAAGVTQVDNFLQTQNHPQTANIGCGTCHSIAVVHGTGTVVVQTGAVEGASTPGAWLLPVQNNAAAAWGGACVDCHETQTFYTTGISASTYPDGTFLNQAGGAAGRHVTGGTGPHGDAMTGCNECHFVHLTGYAAASDPDINFLQTVSNEESDACQTCHTATATLAPEVGGNSHPVDQTNTKGCTMPTTLGATYPVASAINDAVYDAAKDYATTNNYIVCETCHSVHRLGLTARPFLRADNTADAVCVDCHADN